MYSKYSGVTDNKKTRLNDCSLFTPTQVCVRVTPTSVFVRLHMSCCTVRLVPADEEEEEFIFRLGAPRVIKAKHK